MGYTRKPNYHFNTKLDTGIDKVPNSRLIVVEDYDGQTKTFLKVSSLGLTASSTIQDAFTAINIKAVVDTDLVPTDGSTKPVQSNGVFDVLATKLSAGGGPMTGAITGLRETKVAMAANEITLAGGNVFTKTITAATTLTVSGWLASGNSNSFVLELTNGGAFPITWFAGVKWSGGKVPTLTAAGVDILGFYSHDGGVTVRGIVLAKDSK